MPPVALSVSAGDLPKMAPGSKGFVWKPWRDPLSWQLFGSCIILTFRYSNNHYTNTYYTVIYSIYYRLYHCILYQYTIPIFIYHTSPCHEFFGYGYFQMRRNWKTCRRPHLLASSRRWRFSWVVAIPSPSGWKLSPFEYWIPPWFSFFDSPWFLLKPSFFYQPHFRPSLDSTLLVNF
jgi:hypothetical protein